MTAQHRAYARSYYRAGPPGLAYRAGLLIFNGGAAPAFFSRVAILFSSPEICLIAAVAEKRKHIGRNEIKAGNPGGRETALLP